MKPARPSPRKNPRGRPRTGVGTLIGLRWHEPQLEGIDNWRRTQPDLPSRVEAIRRLVHRALNGPNATDQAGELSRMRLGGSTFAEIGRKAGVSAERARQIVNSEQRRAARPQLSVRSSQLICELLGERANTDPKKIARLSSDDLRKARAPKKIVAEIRAHLIVNGLDLSDV